MIRGAQPIGRFRMTRPIAALAAIAGLGAVAMVYRMVAGLGATTALNDGYPWGLWIAFDVVTGTALACGGYGIALLVYIFNKGAYHPLVRPAVLASALGYTLAGLSVALDLGRPWMIWKIPLYVWHWNLDSALLEVALCITAYVVVLWVELSPAALDRWRGDRGSRLNALATRLTRPVDRGLTWVIGLGVLLPTMHQSSLGTLMMLSGPRLHPLWQTWLLPVLFLVSALSMGFAVVVLENLFSHYVLGRRLETGMLTKLTRIIVPLQGAYVAVRLLDLVARADIGLAFARDPYALLFWIEIAMFVVPALVLLSRTRARHAATLFRSAGCLALGGALYRFDTFLVAFQPGDHWSYFPSVGEITITAGLVAMELLAYTAIVHYFPIMSGAPAARVEKAGV